MRASPYKKSIAERSFATALGLPSWGLVVAMVAVLACGDDGRGDETTSSVAPSGQDDDDGDDDSGDDDDDDDDDASDSDGGPQASCDETRIGPRVLRRLTRDELALTMLDAFPSLADAWGGVLMGPDVVDGRHAYDNDHSLKFGAQATADLLATSEDMATLVAARLGELLPCASENPDLVCAEAFVERYGRRLFRRSLTSNEVDRYLDLYTQVSANADFGAAIKWVTVALLQSPNTVYRFELGEMDGDQIRLTPIELASALAYTFSGGPPDDELLTLAEAGELDDGALVEHAERLLASDRGRAVLARFFRGWLHYDYVVAEAKPEIPEFVLVREQMVAEAERYFDATVFDRDANAQTLLTADYTYVDAELGAYYGIDDVDDGGATDRPHGRGLTALGALLASRAQSKFSSPTQRGLLVLERLLCGERADPPQDIPDIVPPEPGVYTTRERYEELHSADPLCAGCHTAFDPMGYGFEHWDEGGRYRVDEFGLPIDASGEIKLGGQVLAKFDDQEDMAERLAELPEVIDCIGAQMSYYAFAGVEDCLADETARERLRTGDASVFEFFTGLAGAPHFTQRR